MKECNCGDYKPYIETMEVGAIHAPMMPFNACVNCYGESMKETLPKPCEHGRLKRQCNECDLQAKNDELLVNHLKAHSMNVRLCSSIAPLHLSIEDEELSEKLRLETVKIIDEFRVDNLTPTQALADIRAEAVMSLIGSDLGFAHSVNEFESEWVYSEDDIKDHANKIKGAE